MNINYILNQMSDNDKDAIIASIIRTHNRIQKALDKTVLILKSSNIVNDIERFVCEQFGISQSEIYSDNNTDNFSGARRMIMYFLRIELGWSAKDIANRMNRDRTTVIVGIKKAKDWLKYDKDFIHKYDNLRKKMQPLDKR